MALLSSLQGGGGSGNSNCRTTLLILACKLITGASVSCCRSTKFMFKETRRPWQTSKDIYDIALQFPVKLSVSEAIKGTA